jgi:hypothetical protein
VRNPLELLVIKNYSQSIRAVSDQLLPSYVSNQTPFDDFLKGFSRDLIAPVVPAIGSGSLSL